MARALAAVGLAALCGGALANAQEVPRPEYLRYLPLSYPRLIRAQPATARFGLFGDPRDPGWRDEAPRDGIDDRSHALLLALAKQFAPILVPNTGSVPLDFRRVLEHQDRLELYVDRWDVSGSLPLLRSSDTVDLKSAAAVPCLGPPPSTPDAARSLREAVGFNHDCKLLELLRRFAPDSPTDPGFSPGAVSAAERPFTVAFVDTRGQEPREWLAEYLDRGRLRDVYRPMVKAYVHPFVRAVPMDGSPAEERYELILQYWFFYPFNNGGNNHEGDWEHVNVVVSPRSLVSAPLSGQALRDLLVRRPERLDAEDPLVMRRIEYFFHHRVMRLDFSRPNAYLPREEWESEARQAVAVARDEERIGLRQLLGDIRSRAWSDRAETLLNRRPIVYIGGDSKGLELLLYSPGPRNRESHGSYPFPGLYKDVGPGSNELIRRVFRHQDYLGKAGGDLPTGLVSLDRPGLLEIVPDWEYLIEAIHGDPGMRASWSWLVLPIRWGYPAVRSPFAGIISHAETGNLAPIGPAFNPGWNTIGPVLGYNEYVPHRLAGYVAHSPQDEFRNSLGFLNAPLAVLTTVPPIDFLYTLVFTPAGAALGGVAPTYWAASEIPARFTGPAVGISAQFMDREVWPDLFFNEDQAKVLSSRVAQFAVDTARASRTSAPPAVSWFVQWNFFVGTRLVTESSLRRSRSDLALFVPVAGRVEPLAITGRLRFWEYSGSLRYNLRTGLVQPHLKLGYGLSWYRLEDVRVEGELLAVPRGPWIRKPSLFPFENLWPNTWHYGVGVEFVPVRRRGRFPGGTDLGFKLDYTKFRHPLGLTFRERARFAIEENPKVGRGSLNLLAVVTF